MEKINLKESLVIISIIYAISLVSSIIYLLYYVDRKNISYIPLIICIFYFSLFIFLNIIAIFDYILHYPDLELDCDILFKFISNFYLILNLASKILGTGVLNIWINYLESGYFSTSKKLFDIFITIYHKIKRIEKWKIIVTLIAFILVFSALLSLFIIYKDTLGLSSPINYICIFLDMYAIFEIYMKVGFFLVQSIIDFKRHRNDSLTTRYYIYSQTKIINETEASFNKIKETYEELNKTIQKMENFESTPYYLYLKKVSKKVEEKVKLYDIENNKDTNSINNNIANTNNDLRILTLNSIDKKSIDELNNKSNNKENNTQNSDTKKQTNEKDDDLSEYIRGFKESVRKIIKLKRKYKDIEEEKKKDLNKTTKIKICFYINYIILFLAFSIVIISDFILPFVLYSNEKKLKSQNNRTIIADKINSNSKNEKKENITLPRLCLEIILMFLLFLICNGYTIILVYSTTRSEYISGDFLYGKHINDDLSLMKTVKLICGYTFSLVHCNLYFWYTFDKDKQYKF